MAMFVNRETNEEKEVDILTYRKYNAIVRYCHAQRATYGKRLPVFAHRCRLSRGTTI